ncbi:MAG: hypothetical protein ABIE03_01660 [Patescibacteria group bacterium]|nr:hypothetical protein [Patescibacteria group bacterium]
MKDWCVCYPRLITSPRFALAISKATITGDYSDPMFWSEEMVNIFAAMSSESSRDIPVLAGGVKIFIANHTSITAVLPAIAKRMPSGEDMPYLFSDINAPYKAAIDEEASFVRQLIARALLRIELSIPFIVPNLSAKASNLKAEILKTAKVDGCIYTGKDMLRMIRDSSLTQNPTSYIIFIENIASRGLDIHPPDPDLVHLTNILLRKLPTARLVFLGYNSDNHIAITRDIPRTEIPFELESNQYPSSQYYGDMLREALMSTVQ